MKVTSGGVLISDLLERGCVEDQPQKLDIFDVGENSKRPWFANLLRLEP